jgi:hypothetical protein
MSAVRVLFSEETEGRWVVRPPVSIDLTHPGEYAEAETKSGRATIIMQRPEHETDVPTLIVRVIFKQGGLRLTLPGPTGKLAT